MAPTTLHDDADPTDYEELRNHLARPRVEHPAARQERTAPAPARQERTAPAPHPVSTRVPVMEWLVAVGHVVARRLRRAPRSPMVPLHPPE